MILRLFLFGLILFVQGCILIPLTSPDTPSSYGVVSHGTVRGHSAPRAATKKERRLTSLLKGLQSPRAVVRTHSVFWIGEMGASGRPAEPKLRELLSNDSSPWVRRGCVKALVKILGPDAKPLLRQALNDSDTWVVHSARNALR